ncbi:hypothetical protein AAFF_G00107110 [Aldrovandia affinis]|uniref:Uncharacterized protein n=1 Tax=Aldrovandia affinis TaxID=143900 RepID=A0AAD7WYR7_9TELE|nr:hypothetical protein AAFF_G00107110 [Aldrovandia affinis]
MRGRGGRGNVRVKWSRAEGEGTHRECGNAIENGPCPPPLRRAQRTVLLAQGIGVCLFLGHARDVSALCRADWTSCRENRAVAGSPKPAPSAGRSEVLAKDKEEVPHRSRSLRLALRRELDRVLK